VTKKIGTIVVLVILSVLVFLISVGKGTIDISIPDVIRAIFIDKEGMNHQIIFNVRLPRTLVAALVGMSLALSGAILQGVMRNPLASPGVIGVSQGAGLAAFTILILFPDYTYLVPIGAFIGAFLATMLIYMLAWKNGIQPVRLILAGVAVSSMLAAGINVLMTLFPDKLGGTVNFMIGELSARTWPHFNMLWPYALLGLFLSFILSGRINILMMGDEIAIGLGVKVEQTRIILIAIASMLAASAVSVVGLLGFVGLIAPHICRILVGTDYKYLFPAAALFGATLLMLCDTLSRLIFSPVEIPVGIIMSLLGAPFFLYLLRERRSFH